MFSYRWANFTLNVDPDITGTVVNETSKTGVLVLTYKALVPAGPKNDTGFLTKATIRYCFYRPLGNRKKLEVICSMNCFVLVSDCLPNEATGT